MNKSNGSIHINNPLALLLSNCGGIMCNIFIFIVFCINMYIQNNGYLLYYIIFIYHDVACFYE